MPAPPDDRTVYQKTGGGRAGGRTVGGAGATGGQGPPKADAPPPDRVGAFRILRKLGRGGMAEVYLAEQDGLKRRVALKILRPDRVAEDDETLIKRFEQEALAAAALNHPNIVQVHSVGRADLPGDGAGGGRTLHYIAQEYVPGPTLRAYLKHKGPPNAKVAVGLLRQVAAALAAAADAGIVHRDIKPENILLTKTGEAKVADFGLARLLDRGEAGVTLTQEGMTLGTPLYMSPEQAEGKKLDARSDLYSLGVTAYHLLAGAPPFRGDNPMAVAMKHLSATARPLGELRPDLPPVLCEIVHKLMSRDPRRPVRRGRGTGRRFSDRGRGPGGRPGGAQAAARQAGRGAGGGRGDVAAEVGPVLRLAAPPARRVPRPAVPAGRGGRGGAGVGGPAGRPVRRPAGQAAGGRLPDRLGAVRRRRPGPQRGRLAGAVGIPRVRPGGAGGGPGPAGAVVPRPRPAPPTPAARPPPSRPNCPPPACPPTGSGRTRRTPRPSPRWPICGPATRRGSAGGSAGCWPVRCCGTPWTRSCGPGWGPPSPATAPASTTPPAPPGKPTCWGRTRTQRGEGGRSVGRPVGARRSAG